MNLQHHHHYPPTPEYEGWVSTRVLEEVVLPAYSAWPCEGHVGGSRSFHYPDTVPGTCRRALAVFCERQCAAQVTLRYVCCPGRPSSPLSVILRCGMNIFVYCSDNFGGGYLDIKMSCHQTLQIVTPPTHTGGEYIYQGGEISSLIYELHRYLTPPCLAVVSLCSEGPPIPTLRTLSRFSAGEIRAVEYIRSTGFQFPSEVQDVMHRFIFVPYVQDMERLRRDKEIAASIITI